MYVRHYGRAGQISTELGATDTRTRTHTHCNYAGKPPAPDVSTRVHAYKVMVVRKR